MKRSTLAALAAIVTLASALPSHRLRAQQSDAGPAMNAAARPVTLAAHRSSGPLDITMDGRLEEGAWRDATPITDFTQQEPVEGGQPSEATEIRVVYDQDNDGVIESATDFVYLLFGMRRGGDNYYMVEVTDRNSPKLRWIKSYPELGQTWSPPVVAKIDIDSSAHSSRRHSRDLHIHSSAHSKRGRNTLYDKPFGLAACPTG